MSRHQLDLIPCLKTPGARVGYLCERCNGQCPTCGSFVRPKKLVKICEECSFTSSSGSGSGTGPENSKCILCSSPKCVGEAYYCVECVLLEKDRDGCPRITNLGSSKKDYFFDSKKKLQIQ